LISCRDCAARASARKQRWGRSALEQVPFGTIFVLEGIPEQTMNGRHERVALSLISLITLACVPALAAGCGSSDSGASAGSKASSSSHTTAATKATKPKQPSWVLTGNYAPTIDPANFATTIDNRYFPLQPGTAFHYKGTADGTPQTDDMVVTDQKKTILGVTCTVVEDTVSERGKAIERTFDWYAQDKQGNVWYMGEDSLELKNGHFVRADDSWESGVKGAQPGIIMPANPQPGDVYRQEYYPPGGALDQAHVLHTDGTMKVEYGSFDNVLVTEEWSPVEPQIEQKSYVAGVGEIEEHVTAGGHEQFQLVSITHP
jgi:hypothetical protein